MNTAAGEGGVKTVWRQHNISSGVIQYRIKPVNST